MSGISRRKEDKCWPSRKKGKPPPNPQLSPRPAGFTVSIPVTSLSSNSHRLTRLQQWLTHCTSSSGWFTAGQVVQEALWRMLSLPPHCVCLPSQSLVIFLLFFFLFYHSAVLWPLRFIQSLFYSSCFCLPQIPMLKLWPLMFWCLEVIRFK
jgi:hypothetical protein